MSDLTKKLRDTERALKLERETVQRISRQRDAMAADVERLRKQVTGAAKLVSETQKERDQLNSILQGVNTSDYRFSVYQLARHDADVIESLKAEMLEYVAKLRMQPGVEFAADFMDDKIDQLRQQAKEPAK